MAAKKAAAKKRAAKKKAPAKKSTAARTAAKKPPAGTQKASKKAAAKAKPAKKSAAKKSTAAKAKPAKQSAAKKAADKKTAAKSTRTKQAAGRQTTATKTTAKQPARAKQAAPARAKRAATTPTSTEERPTVHELPKPRFNKDGFGYTKDFDLSFVKQMYEMLQAERVELTGQAKRLEDEAHQLVEEAEMGDVQFDDEGGEGDTMVVERERDLALSAQAREAVIDIDAAIDRIMSGTYGYSIVSGEPIPRERLEAIPWSAELVEEKVGGIGRR